MMETEILIRTFLFMLGIVIGLNFAKLIRRQLRKVEQTKEELRKLHEE